jgi:EAL domain-containing protein (putative c-di-GMP-specific phosphodiesterase class I)
MIQDDRESPGSLQPSSVLPPAESISSSNRKRCNRCEMPPASVLSEGALFLWFPVGHSLAKTYDRLRQAGINEVLHIEQGLKLLLHHSELYNIGKLLNSTLSEPELKSTKALLLSDSSEPQLCDFPRVTSLQQIIGLSQADWLLSLLNEGRITTHFQPIVWAHDPSQVFAQEALLRGISEQGEAIAPAQMLSVASSADILPQLDLAARRSAIQQAAHHQIKDYLFINFIPGSIYDPVACLRSTVSAVKEAGIPQNRVVFEVVESDRVQDVNHLKRILDFYREAGFLVALDDFGAGYSNLNLVHQLKPDFIKLDMELIRNVHQDAYKALITQKLLEIAHQLEIKTIAEGIESAEELNWVCENGATLVQGYFIARPGVPPIALRSPIAA